MEILHVLLSKIYCGFCRLSIKMNQKECEIKKQFCLSVTYR